MGASQSQGGESTDEEDVDGPVHGHGGTKQTKAYGGFHEPDTSRHCTDVTWCGIFAVTLAGLTSVFAGAMGGDMRRLYHGIDHTGAVCGVSPAVRQKPYVFWCRSPVSEDGVSVDLDLSSPICVSACPAAAGDKDYDSEATRACTNVTGSLIYADYPTTLVLRRYCLPQHGPHAQAVGLRLGQSSTVWMRDAASIAAAWPALLGAFLLAFVLGYAYLLLLKRYARHALLAAITLSMVTLSCLGVHLLCFSQATMTANGEELPSGLGLHRQAAARLMGCICLLLGLAVAFSVCCYNRTILLAAACVEMCCEVVFEMPAVVLLPALQTLGKGLLSLALLFGLLQLQASAVFGHEVRSDGMSHVSLGTEQWVQTVFYLLAGLWLLVFTNAACQFAVAYAAAEYYYEPFDEDMQKSLGIWTVWTGLCLGLVYHPGSLALGSLLLAILKIFQKGLKQADQKQDCELVRCVLECLQFVLLQFQDLVEVVAEVAYVDVAVNSSSFCSAARSAIGSLSSEGSTFLVLGGAVHAFTFFGTAAITAVTTLVTYVTCTHGVYADTTSEFLVENPHVPTTVAAGLAYLVALSFSHVFDMTSDTLLYCYALDLQHGEPAVTAPPALRRLVIGSQVPAGGKRKQTSS